MKLLFVLGLVAVATCATDFKPVWNTRALPVKSPSSTPTADQLRNAMPKLPRKPNRRPQATTAGKSAAENITASGDVTNAKQFPWNVVIVTDTVNLCSGALIDVDWVITASSCVKNTNVKNVQIYAGITDYTTATAPNIMSAIQIRSYARVNPNNYRGDLALIKLQAPVKVGENINIIRLPSITQADLGDSYFNTNETSAALVTGWGITGETGAMSGKLQTIESKITNNSACAMVYGWEAMNFGSICSTPVNATVGVCAGNAGAPLQIIETDKQWTIVGVTSHGSAKSCLGYPTVYTRVSSYLDWIAEITGIVPRS